MARLANRLLWLVLFTTPWFFGIVSFRDVRFSSLDLLGPACAFAALAFTTNTSLRMAHYALGAYVLIAFASVLQLLTDDAFLLLFFKCIRLAGIIAPAFLFGVLPRPEKQWSRLIRAYYWGGLASVVYGITAFYFQWSFGTAVQQYYYDNNAYLRRAGGVFQDSSAFGHLLATWTAVAVLFVHKTGRKHLIALLITLAIAGAGLYACLSRAAVVHLLVIVALVCVLPRPDRASLGAVHVTTAALAGLMLLLLASSDVRQTVLRQASFAGERLYRTYASALDGMEALDDSGANRITTWARTIEIWEQHPLLGTGYKSLVQLYGIYSDNTAILTLAETGVIGLLVFLAGVTSFFSAAVRSYWRRLPASREVVIFLIGQAVHSILVDTITFTGSMPIVFLIGIAACRPETFVSDTADDSAADPDEAVLEYSGA